MADPIVDAILSNQQNREFWQGTLRNLVQTIAQIPQMREQAAERRALAEDRMAQTQLRQGQLQVLQQQQAMKLRQQQTMDNVNRYMSQVMDDDGNVRMDVFGQMMQGVPVDQAASVVTHIKTVQDFAQKAKEAKNAYLVKALDAAIAQKTPEAYEFAIAHAVKNKMIAPDDAQSLYAQLASGQDPTALAKQMRDTLAGPKAEKVPTNQAELAFAAAQGNPTAANALGMLQKMPTEKTPAVGSFEDYVGRYAQGKGKPIEQLTPADIEDARKRYQQADDRPRITVQTGEGSDVKEQVAGMKDGTLPPVLPGRQTKEYGAVLAEAHRQGFDLVKAATDWTATQKHIATLNNAQQTRLNQAINQLPELLDSVDALATKWKGGRFPILNKANLALAKNGAFGENAASIARQLDAQIADVTGDLGAVYMGGNSPTDHSLKLAEKALAGDWSEKVLHDMVALARQNVKTRQNSIRNTGVQGASPDNPYAPSQAPTTGGGTPSDWIDLGGGIRVRKKG